MILNNKKDLEFINMVLLKGNSDVIKGEDGEFRWRFCLGKGYVALDEDDDIYIKHSGRHIEIGFDLEDAIESKNPQMQNIANKLLSLKTSNPKAKILSVEKFVARLRSRKGKRNEL